MISIDWLLYRSIDWLIYLCSLLIKLWGTSTFFKCNGKGKQIKVWSKVQKAQVQVIRKKSVVIHNSHISQMIIISPMSSWPYDLHLLSWVEFIWQCDLALRFKVMKLFIDQLILVVWTVLGTGQLMGEYGRYVIYHVSLWLRVCIIMTVIF